MPEAIFFDEIPHNAAGDSFQIPSTVHKDITDRLEHLNRTLYIQVQAVLGKNKCERHIRGGMATREKYREARAHRGGEASTGSDR